MDFQYIVDENGKKKSVIVPIKEWEQLLLKKKKAVAKSRKEPRVLQLLEKAVAELNLIKSGEKKPSKNLGQLLDEL